MWLRMDMLKIKCITMDMVKVIEYHFVSSHELSKCIIRNNVEVWISNKGTQTLCNLYLFCAFRSQSKILHYSRCQMPDVSMIFPTNINFCFESFWNIISAFRQASFSQNTLSSFNFFFLSPPSPFSFLGVDFGVCNSFRLVPRFHDGKVLFERFVAFNSLLFKLWSEFRDRRR